MLNSGPAVEHSGNNVWGVCVRVFMGDRGRGSKLGELCLGMGIVDRLSILESSHLPCCHSPTAASDRTFNFNGPQFPLL